jgi:hypothetical protein
MVVYSFFFHIIEVTQFSLTGPNTITTLHPLFIFLILIVINPLKLSYLSLYHTF